MLLFLFLFLNSIFSTDIQRGSIACRLDDGYDSVIKGCNIYVDDLTSSLFFIKPNVKQICKPDTVRAGTYEFVWEFQNLKDKILRYNIYLARYINNKKGNKLLLTRLSDVPIFKNVEISLDMQSTPRISMTFTSNFFASDYYNVTDTILYDIFCSIQLQ